MTDETTTKQETVATAAAEAPTVTHPFLLGRKIGMMHLHVNPADILDDHNVALPTDVLDEFTASGVIGGTTGSHVSVMGYQASGLDVWRNETAPAIVSLFKDEGADGVVLAPV